MNAISAMPTSSMPAMPLSDVPDVSSFHVDPHNPKSAEQVAKGFESVFAAMVLKEMRNTLDSKTLFGGDNSDVYGGIFDQFMGQALTQGGGFGLAREIQQRLSHLTGSHNAHEGQATLHGGAATGEAISKPQAANDKEITNYKNPVPKSATHRIR